MKKVRERREIALRSGAASASKCNTSEAAPKDECNTETDNIIDSNDHSFDGAGRDSSDSCGISDSDGEDDRADKFVGKRPVLGDTSNRSNVTDEDWDAKNSLHAKMFQTKKIWSMAKMLCTTKDTVRFTEENTDIVIESKATRLSNACKKK